MNEQQYIELLKSGGLRILGYSKVWEAWGVVCPKCSAAGYISRRAINAMFKDTKLFCGCWEESALERHKLKDRIV